MASNQVKINFSAQSDEYTVKIGHDLLADCGKWARKCLGKDAGKIVVVSNPTVFKLYGPQTIESLTSAGFAVTHFLMKDGEQYKDLRST
ncbi:MAG: 3-dehydroquinate synthase, partial [Pyrinomonadaceae bacterium]